MYDDLADLSVNWLLDSYSSTWWIIQGWCGWVVVVFVLVLVLVIIIKLTGKRKERSLKKLYKNEIIEDNDNI